MVVANPENHDKNAENSGKVLTNTGFRYILTVTVQEIERMYACMKRYVAPIVASALMLASSLMCTGCDETDGDGTSTGGSFVVVTDENGSEYTVFVEEVTEPEPKIVTLPEKEKGVLEATIGSFNFEDAINQKYSKKASALIEEALKDRVMMEPDGTGSAEKKQ